MSRRDCLPLNRRGQSAQCGLLEAKPWELHFPYVVICMFTCQLPSSSSLEVLQTSFLSEVGISGDNALGSGFEEKGDRR